MTKVLARILRALPLAGLLLAVSAPHAQQASAPSGKQQATTIAMRVGQMKILLPDNVDTTTTVRMDGGRAQVFGREWDGRELGSQEITDLGPDGAGGGSLRLTIELNTGDLEVTR